MEMNIDRVTQAVEVSETLVGTVVFKFENKGSKSEGMFPFLYIKNGEFVRIWLDGDFSLFGDCLKDYDGRHVTVRGKKNEYDLLIITSIEITDAANVNDNK